MRFSKPMLEERSRGREEEIGNAYGQGKQSHDPEKRIGLGAVRLPLRIRRDREEEEGERKQRKMESHLGPPLFPEKGDENVRVSIAAEQTDLEKEEAGRPYSRAASIPRKNVARDDRLHLKEQEGAQENGEEEQGHGAGTRKAADGCTDEDQSASGRCSRSNNSRSALAGGFALKSTS